MWLAATMLPGATVGAGDALPGAAVVAVAVSGAVPGAGSAVMRRRPKAGSRRAAVRLSMVWGASS